MTRTGRPKSDDPRDRIIRARVTESEEAAFLAAAGEQSLSDWLRDAARKSAKLKPLRR